MRQFIHLRCSSYPVLNFEISGLRECYVVGEYQLAKVKDLPHHNDITVSGTMVMEEVR